ncbi:ankyrin repeat protein [Reticulomyxa filosa]|uniref:Ankyrin repeat protein n=1 Tax=Reticulomyxa filosa TaxID=46433 RepID=X6NXB3_RETFI|nr:ankyrin repeat protein [Reticulomyxa filosa]|eukprot:ETO30528.1 ankyrin repeat protein [Reticulomyxa filosa]
MPVGLDGKTSRQQLLQRQFWRAVHRNNYKELNWLLRSRQHINMFEANEQDQIGIIVLGLRYDWSCVELMAKNGGGLRHLCRYASFYGDTEILKFVHTQLRIDVTTLHDEFDELLLFSAVEGSQPTVIRQLADWNADLAAKSMQGDSAILLAAQKGDKEIVQLLNERGLEIGVTDEQGNTIAHHAALVFNGKNILEYLVSKYGDEFRHDALSRGDSNVSASSTTSDLDGVQVQRTVQTSLKLYTTGFNFDSRNNNGATPAYNAAWKGQLQNLEVLAGVGCNLDLGNEDGNTPLIAAAMTDQPSSIAFLIDHGCEVNQMNKGEETALYWAAYNCSAASLEVLLEKGASIEKCDKYGNSPLLVASDHGEVKAVRILLKYNANVNHQNQIGETALMKACAEGHLECVQELVRSSLCNPDVRDDEGNTALLWACMTGQMDVFGYLIEFWNVTKEQIATLQNNDEETCIDWIVENKLQRGIDILKKLGVDVPEREVSQSRSKSYSHENDIDH